MILLHKINNSKYMLEEIKSVVLMVFYRYPTSEKEIYNSKHVNEFKVFVSKIILLIGVANLVDPSDNMSECYIQNVNIIISRSLMNFQRRKPSRKNFNQAVKKNRKLEN
ncbi:hypothetical protein NGRA_0489 [Nosema granulosis]|uniref:Uncharacterized protein n=1 Tax=Nosema granulosis TaxID=83296 RepID=A0A9P6H1W8_9MICR|nr:hypothetical protein NGRA_0489 [Nosema granulosis]